jgi:transcriptional regulator with XRE-family HTH domain
MKVKITGHRVRQIREALGMTVPQLATVMAVHAGTLHRWEASGPEPIAIDGVAANILAALNQKVPPSPTQAASFNPDEVGQQVIQALLVGGALLALGHLISELVGKGKR